MMVNAKNDGLGNPMLAKDPNVDDGLVHMPLTGVYLVSYDMVGNDPLLVVAKSMGVEQQPEVVNAFQGMDARYIYNMLVTKPTKE